MTLVMAWRETDLARVWIVSDSRLSQLGERGRVRLTDRGAKLMSAELILHRQAGTMIFGEVVARRALSFAYSGSALVALQSYAAVVPLWGHLQTLDAVVLPGIEHCAVHLGHFVAAYAREVSAAHNSFQPCEILLLGYDDGLGDLDGWCVRATPGEGPGFGCERIDLAPGSIHLAGSGVAAAEERLAEIRREQAGLWHREPLRMIRADLREDRAGDVGGAVQLGCLTPAGFELLYDAQPVAAGSPLVDMRFRGFDFSEIGRVGDVFINMRGMT